MVGGGADDVLTVAVANDADGSVVGKAGKSTLLVGGGPGREASAVGGRAGSPTSAQLFEIRASFA